MLFKIQIAVYRLFGDKAASLRLRMGRDFAAACRKCL